MSLSSLIVQREVATIRDVEEALARQVLYGGDLVTNLLEVCRVDESALNLLVADSLGLPAAPPGELPAIPAEAKKLIAPEVAHDRAFAPLSIDQYGVVLAVAEPLSSEAEQELAFAVALPITQQVAPLVRIREALARDYGIPLDRRTTRVLGKMRGDLPRGTPSMRPPSVSAPPPPRPPSIAPPPSFAPPPEPARGRVEGSLVRDVEAPPARPTRRRRGPLTLEVARAELEEAEERDTILDLVFEFARQYFDYTALFLVKDEVAEGRDAFGDGASRDKVTRIGVPLDQPSMLAEARSTKTIVRGKPAAAGIDAMLVADLGRPRESRHVILPVVVRTRVVALVLCDAGEGIDEESLTDVATVVGAATAAFERLIVRRKLMGTLPPPAVSAGSSPPARARSEPPPTKLSAEELPQPIREAMEPASAPKTTVRQLADVVAAAGAEDRKAPLSAQPPPPNLLEVRRPSRRPIPREEPQSTPAMQAVRPEGERAPSTQASPEPPPRRSSSSGLRRAEAPPLDFAPQPQTSLLGEQPFAEDEVERQLLDQIHGAAPATRRDVLPPDMSMVPREEPAPTSSPKAESPPPPPPRPQVHTAVSPGALPMFPDPTPKTPPIFDDELTRPAPPVAPVFERSMPPSEQQVSVSPRRPPSSHNVDRVLPSVIVDVSSEYVAYVDRVIAGNDDEAESELLRAGGHAMPAIMARFPGPITADKAKLEDGVLPRVGECGPVLRLVSSQRRTALPSVLALVEDPNDERRFWATYLLTELVYADAIEPALRRLFDDEPRVRRAARAALRVLAEAHPTTIVERLETLAKDKSTGPSRRARAATGLGDTREALAVPAAIRLLGDRSGEVAAAAHKALVVLTRQDLGMDEDKWSAWWSKNEGRHRFEWLVDALTHDQAQIRGAAGEELKTLTKEYFGYYDDMPKREREKVQQKYRDWWNNIGRVRFTRSR
jgi:hypothetical protein